MERPEFVLCRLQGQGFAELRLSAGTLEEDNEVARHGERHGAAQVFLHERQRQVDPRRHPESAEPSHTKIGSGSTRTAGKRWASFAQYIQ